MKATTFRLRRKFAERSQTQRAWAQSYPGVSSVAGIGPGGIPQALLSLCIPLDSLTLENRMQ